MWRSINEAASYVGGIVAPIADDEGEEQQRDGERRRRDGQDPSDRSDEVRQLRRDNELLQQRIQEIERQFLHNNAALRQLLDARQNELQECQAQVAALQAASEAPNSSDSHHSHRSPEVTFAMTQTIAAKSPQATTNGESKEDAERFNRLESEVRRLHSECDERKTQLASSQAEVRKLREVITQLRSANVQSKSDMGELRKENEELKIQLQRQSKEAKDRYDELSQGTLSAEAVEQAYEQLAAATDRVEQLETSLLQRTSALQACEAELEEAKRRHEEQLTVLHKQYEEELSSLRAAEADFELMRADLLDRDTQLANLQAALVQLEHDKLEEASNMRTQFQKQLEQLERHHQTELQATQQEVKQLANNELQAVGHELQEARLETSKLQALHHHQATEMQNLRTALDKALANLQRPHEDSIDRELISNLIVSYFQRRRSREVLELIARVLAFNDEQLVVVGLKQAEGGLLSAIVGQLTEAEDASQSEPPDVEANSLSELWVKFLMHEAQGDDH